MCYLRLYARVNQPQANERAIVENLCPCGKTLMVKIKKRLKNRGNSEQKNEF